MAMQLTRLTRKLILILASGVGLIVLGQQLEIHLPDIEQWVLKLGIWAPAGFIALFVLLTPLLVSVDALCFAAGLLFSLPASEFYMVLATYFSAAFIFFLGRYLFKEKVEDLLARRQKISDWKAVLEQHAFKMMFLLRLTPLPFALLSYAFSAAKVRFWPYLFATSGIFLYNGTLVYLGYTTKHIAGLISAGKTPTAVPHSLLLLGLVASLAVLFYVSKLASRTLRELSAGK